MITLLLLKEGKFVGRENDLLRGENNLAKNREVSTLSEVTSNVQIKDWQDTRHTVKAIVRFPFANELLLYRKIGKFRVVSINPNTDVNSDKGITGRMCKNVYIDRRKHKLLAIIETKNYRYIW